MKSESEAHERIVSYTGVPLRAVLLDHLAGHLEGAAVSESGTGRPTVSTSIVGGAEPLNTQHSFDQKLAGKVTSKFKNAVRVTGVFAPNLNVSKPRVAPPSPPLKLYESKLVNLFDPT